MVDPGHYRIVNGYWRLQTASGVIRWFGMFVAAVWRRRRIFVFIVLAPISIKQVEAREQKVQAISKKSFGSHVFAGGEIQILGILEYAAG